MCGGDQVGAHLGDRRAGRTAPRAARRPARRRAAAAGPRAAARSSARSWCRRPPWPRPGRTCPGRARAAGGCWSDPVGHVTSPPTAQSRARSASSDALRVVRPPLRHPDHARDRPGRTRRRAQSARPRLRTDQRVVGALVDLLRLGRSSARRPSSLAVREHQVAARGQRVAQRAAAAPPGRSSSGTKCSTATTISSPTGWSKSSSPVTSGWAQDRRPGARRSSWHDGGAVVAGQDLPGCAPPPPGRCRRRPPGRPGRPLGDLVHVADGRDAGADVEELPDARRRPGSRTARRRNARLAWATSGDVRAPPRSRLRRARGRPRSCASRRGSSRTSGRRWAVRGRCPRVPSPAAACLNPFRVPRERLARGGYSARRRARQTVRARRSPPAIGRHASVGDRPGAGGDPGAIGPRGRGPPQNFGASGASSRPSRSAVINACARLAAPSFS